MKHESFYTCDLCGKRSTDGRAVRGNVSVFSGDSAVIYSDVCDKCAGKALDAMSELSKFPIEK